MAKLLYQGPGRPTPSETSELHRAFRWLKANGLIEPDDPDVPKPVWYHLTELGREAWTDTAVRGLWTRARRTMSEQRKQEIRVYRRMNTKERQAFLKMTPIERAQHLRDKWSAARIAGPKFSSADFPPRRAEEED
jgi:hypothetical protein